MSGLKLTVLNNLLNDELFGAFTESSLSENKFALFLNKLYESGYEENFYGYVENLIFKDENAFSRRCACKKMPSEFLFNAYKADLKAILEAVFNADEKNFYAINYNPSPVFDSENYDVICRRLAGYYNEKGYGIFIDNSVFTYDGRLAPIKNNPKICLSDLKEYDFQKKQIENNIMNLMSGLPFSHTLLYGDRGTGKSSTVHALLNEHSDEGLKLIEISNGNLCKLAEIFTFVSGLPFKFLLFIDDLALDCKDDLSNLKASLEGSFIKPAGNAMLIVTSNRRHIVKENFSDRENAVHETDALEEQLSLSDRFGLTIIFPTTDKSQYLSIVRQLASDKKLKTDEKTVTELAERWALQNGGRSPRKAKQFIDTLYSCEIRNTKFDF